MKSETIGKLAEALAKAQGMMEFAKKDSMNPHFKNKYADIAAVIEAIREPLSKNNLSYVQYEEEKEGSICLITELFHTSGEWVRGEMKLLLTKQDMQGLGSALTYARRYSLSAMMGIAQDDDDGQAAVSRPKVEVTQWKMNTEDFKNLTDAMNAAKFTPKQVTELIQSKFGGKQKSSELSKEEFDRLLKMLDPPEPGSFDSEIQGGFLK